MSDLLSSLVDRALDRAPVLQRRQPTLFEPVAEAAFNQQSRFKSAAPIDEENNLVESDTTAAPSRPKSPGRASMFSLPKPEAEATEKTNIEPRHARSRPSINIVQPLQIEREYREPAETQARVESTSHPIVEEERLRPSREGRQRAQPEAPSAAPPRMIETIIEKRVEREIISEPARRNQTAGEPQAVDHPSVIPRKPAAEDNVNPKRPVKIKSESLRPVKDEPAVKPRTRKKPAPPPPVSAPIRAAARSNAARAARQSAPPAIHVTIGRVEVRATPQAPARPKLAPVSGPRMSLDDYLRSRGEGS